MPRSKSLFFDKKVVTTYYYKNNTHLSTRISSWNRYGTNTQTLYEWLWSLLCLHKGNAGSRRSILDVGCGTGEMLAYFNMQQKKLNIYGVDISAPMLKKAAYKNIKSRQNFHLSNITELPFEDNFFDITTAVFVLHHVPNLSRALAELVRVTKKKGIILIADGDYDVQSGLNAVHYSTLRKLRFPDFMKDTTAYLRTSRQCIGQMLKRFRLKGVLHTYKNDMIFYKANQALRYYLSLIHI